MRRLISNSAFRGSRRVKLRVMRAAASGLSFAAARVMAQAPQRFVYMLRSLREPNRPYVGLTSDMANRLGFHNAGLSRHTAKYRPWALVVSIEFPDESRAVAFEKYLKSGSGRAFAKRHFEL
jgi:putative endonuclease